MAERVGGLDAGDGEHGLACGANVADDDLGLPRVAVPFERDRETGVVACVEFNEHEGISLASLVTPVVSMGNECQKIRRSVTAIYCTMV
jgi:hypothetical protein